MVFFVIYMCVVFILPIMIITLMLSDIIEMISNLWDNSKKKKLTRV